MVARIYSSKDELKKITPLQEETIKLLTQKSAKTGFLCQIRIISLAKTKEQAKVNMRNIFSSFSQFSSPDRNGFRLYELGDNKEFLTHYILRTFYWGHRMVLNSEELASLYHFPTEHIDTPGIRWHMAKRSAVPANIPHEGIILGKNFYRGEEVLIRLKQEDRRRHLMLLNDRHRQTTFESLILQDIKEGRGVAVLTLMESWLDCCQNSNQERRMLFIDPSDTAANGS